MSIRLGIPFSALLAEDDQTLATYYDLLEEVDRAERER